MIVDVNPYFNFSFCQFLLFFVKIFGHFLVTHDKTVTFTFNEAGEELAQGREDGAPVFVEYAYVAFLVSLLIHGFFEGIF